MGRACASERVPIALAEADQRTPGEGTSPPLPSRRARRQGLNGPCAPHQAACEPPSALSGGDEGVEDVRGLQRASRQDRERHLGAARCGGRAKASTCALVTHAQPRP